MQSQRQADMSTIESRIIELHASGMKQEDIALVLKTGRHRISRTIRFFNETGLISAPLHPGRPRKVTDAIMDFIEVRTLQNAGLPGNILSEEISNRFATQLSKATVNQIRNKLQFKYQRPRHIQQLTDTQIEDRIAFCQKMLEMPPESLGLIHFSDESRVVLGKDNQCLWYRKGEDNPSACVTSSKFPPSLMIFAVVGIGYKSRLLFVDGTIDAEKYIQNLHELNFIEDLDQKYGALQWIFQQDGATCHTSQIAMDWLDENCDVISDWPSNSPDLSPIELLWAILKRMTTKLRPKSIDELKTALGLAWDMIKQNTIDRLCESFSARLKLCLSQDGRSISNFLYQLSDKEALRDFVMENKRHQPWTAEEDRHLLDLHSQLGNRWKMISRLMSSRNSCQIKNRWNTVLRKRLLVTIDDTELQLAIRSKLRDGQPVTEIPMGDC